MPAQKRTILVADDDHQILKFVAHNLQFEDYEVLTAHDGRQALALIQGETPDLVLLDLMMPQMEYVSLCDMHLDVLSEGGVAMIVHDIMTTKLITVAPDDTLGHAANLLRQYQFHHLPVAHTVRIKSEQTQEGGYTTFLHVHFLKGMLSSQDIDLAAQGEHTPSAEKPDASWRGRQVAHIMQPVTVSVTPTTSVASAALTLLERDLTCVPVIAYAQNVFPPSTIEGESLPVLVGILTRSDLLLALAHITGVDKPGMELMLPLAGNDVSPLATLLLLAMELHIQVHSVLLASHRDGVPRVVTVRLGTINPAPLLLHLQEAHIRYVFGTSEMEGELSWPTSTA